MPGRFVSTSFNSRHSFELSTLSGNRNRPNVCESLGKTCNCKICMLSFCRCCATHKPIIFQNLELWTDSAEAWRSAATCLPPLDQFTDADKRLSIQIGEGLEKAEAAVRKEKEPEVRAFKSTTILPWQRADSKLEKLQEEKVSSVSSTTIIVCSGLSA